MLKELWRRLAYKELTFSGHSYRNVLQYVNDLPNNVSSGLEGGVHGEFVYSFRRWFIRGSKIIIPLTEGNAQSNLFLRGVGRKLRRNLEKLTGARV